jgi:hypothetical protein
LPIWWATLNSEVRKASSWFTITRNDTLRKSEPVGWDDSSAIAACHACAQLVSVGFSAETDSRARPSNS